MPCEGQQIKQIESALLEQLPDSKYHINTSPPLAEATVRLREDLLSNQL